MEIHVVPNRYKHGENGRVENITWLAMMARCYNPKCKGFKYYGDRGIRVCEEWHNYEKFLADMGRKPKGKTLGRKDNNGNYELSNCEWQTVTKQNRNKRGVRLTIAKAREIRMLHVRGYTNRELAREFKVSFALVSKIINRKIWKE